MVKDSVVLLNNNGDKRGMHPNSLKNLKPRWQKGQSGNSQGKLCLTDLLKKELQEVIDYIVPGLPPNKDKLSGSQLIVKALVLAGVKGKMDAVREIFDRVEGKVTLPIESSGTLEITNAKELTDEELAVIAANNIITNHAFRSSRGTTKETSSS